MSVELDKATQKILDFCALVPDRPSLLENFNINMISGEARLIGIANDNNVTICKLIVEDGSEGEWHAHEEMKRFIGCSGGSYTMEYKIDDVLHSKRVYKNIFYANPGTPHRIASSTGRSESTIVLIPGSPNFPKGH